MYKISDEMTYSQGALVEPLAISVHGLRYCRFETGMNVAVIGSSSIGLGAIASAKFFGASKIIASAKYPHQAEVIFNFIIYFYSCDHIFKMILIYLERINLVIIGVDMHIHLVF